MTGRVIDSSVLLAALQMERGMERALELSFGGCLSSVIYAEFLAKCAMRTGTLVGALDLIEALDIETIALTQTVAARAGALKLDRRFWPLSLADCICIATAVDQSATLITADRAWAELSLPCPIEVIR